MGVSSLLSVGGVMPSIGKLASGDIGGAILDLVFKDSALILEYPGLVYGSKVSQLSIPLPLIGFQFKAPEVLTLLKYEYAKYPYLNKATIANSFIKEVCPIEITGLRPILRTNPIALNVPLNHAGVKYLIEKYADHGGTWTIITAWGLYKGLVLTGLEGILEGESDTLGGIGFKFTFEKLNISDTSSVSKMISEAMGKLS